MIWNDRQLNKSLNTAASYAESDTVNSNLVRLVEDPSIKKDIQFDELSTAYVEGLRIRWVQSSRSRCSAWNIL